MESLSRTIYQFPLLCYLGAITLVTALTTAAVLGQAYTLGSGGWMLVLASIFLVICISSPAVGLVNWLATLLVRPHALPRMDFSSGIPQKLRWVVPSVITGKSGICWRS
jgi:hypothetical protein